SARAAMTAVRIPRDMSSLRVVVVARPSATHAQYNRGEERFPRGLRVGERPSLRTDNAGSMDREHEREADEDEDRGADERHAVRIEAIDEQSGDDRADRLRERPNGGADAGHLRCALRRHQVDQKWYRQRR